jgi:hypothetical protein
MGRNRLRFNHVCVPPPPSIEGAAWAESYQGCCAEAEWAQFQELATDIMRVQLKNQQHAGAGGHPQRPDRAFHAKSTLVVEDAKLRFRKEDELPANLQAGFVKPGAEYVASVRFSNASGGERDDRTKDMRGVALRVTVSPDEQHDLLLTNFPVSHARDARQFVRFAKATAGGGLSRGAGVARLLVSDPIETIRMLRNVSQARTVVDCIATQTYWSRGAIRWGEKLAVRYLLEPVGRSQSPSWIDRTDPTYLSREISRRLANGDVQFTLCVQLFRDEKSTPIEDTAVRWSSKDAPSIPVADLIISKRDLSDAYAGLPPTGSAPVNYNPWNTTDNFRPLGNLNRARKTAYDASAGLRHQLRWHTDPPLRNVVFSAVARGLFSVVNRRWPWYKLGVKPGLINIVALRQTLQRENRFDTESHDAPPSARSVPCPPPEDARTQRSPAGLNNDLSAPKMGAVGATFGRNVPPDYQQAGPGGGPNPIIVSRELLYRDQFRPALSLNVLAAAWIQFQIHDWVDHARYPLNDRPGELGHDIEIPMPEGREWTSLVGRAAEPKMLIAGNKEQPGGQLYNATTFWGDASELYGSSGLIATGLRNGAKVALVDGYLPEGVGGLPQTGFTEGWWLGLAGLHTLFAREHNVLCDELRAHYKSMTDEQVYQTARLIVAALITKIHTLEWTPAILARETLELGMNALWSGPPSKDWLTRLGTWLIDSHASVGVPATTPDHRGVAFSLTEDFTAVYRLHPLLPDDYQFSDSHTGTPLSATMGFHEIQGSQADDVLTKFGLRNVLYSFGVSNPGAITLHNYPRGLQNFSRTNQRGEVEIIDLSVVDLVRNRLRGVPRYNDFRGGLHMPRIKSFQQLTSNQDDVDILRTVYGGDIDSVDAMIGLFAETPPEGFGFSDTAFRIFISTATNRIQSDRFLTVDFRPGIYTPFGMDWINNNTMRSVILRHCPELAAVVPRENAFGPWRQATTW